MILCPTQLSACKYASVSPSPKSRKYTCKYEDTALAPLLIVTDSGIIKWIILGMLSHIIPNQVTLNGTKQ